jgi:hypothetical protein
MDYDDDMASNDGYSVYGLATQTNEYLSLSDDLLHHKKKHAALSLVFQCLKCDKQYSGKHAAQCHLPKCTGRKEAKAILCPHCKDSFETVSGLSQHKRSRHPLVRNAERLAPVSLPEKTARPGRSFSVEEIELMLQLEEDLKGDKRIAMKMAELIETKTARQIRNKRRKPAYIAKRDARSSL